MKIIPLSIPVMLLILLGCSNLTQDVNNERPNILLIITDDQGYGDIGIHGNPYIQTPVIDSLARLSVRIDPFYVSPVCAPTRSSLLTGRYHLRTGVYDTYNGGAMMSTDELTIAELLSENGYRTAMIGKWHLGDAYPMRPMDQGFQYYLAHKGGGIGQPGDDFGNFIRKDSSYFNPFLWENGIRVRREGYCSDVFTDQAIDYIKEHVQKDKGEPFFLYLSYNAPHTPLQLPGEYAEKYADMEYGPGDFTNSGKNVAEMRPRDMEDARKVYGMVSNIDDNLGRLWESLSELGIEENTLVVFMTDNGPQQRRYLAGFSGRKSSVLEGGIRVPIFFHWKGELDENRVVSYPSAHIDILPTLLEVAGAEKTDNIDGISLFPLLTGQSEKLQERPLFFVWQRGYPQKYTNMAVRKGNYKLAGLSGDGGLADSLKLFNLKEDPGELNNLSQQNPGIFKELKDDLDSWYEDVINSPNLLTAPRIVLGSEKENPVILNRNDWKGPMAKRWSSANAFGYWDVDVWDPGPYDIKLVFEAPLLNGNAIIRAGARQYKIANNVSGLSEITISSMNLNKGEQMFEGWYESRGELITPIYIEVRNTSAETKSN
ncbi:MAG TPA: arylsulfatase [Bacteroides sp.]|nr:arylsulfatase [Bacteroides sp.]